MKSIYNESGPQAFADDANKKTADEIKIEREEWKRTEEDLREYIGILKAENINTEALATRLVQIQVQQELLLGKIGRQG